MLNKSISSIYEISPKTMAVIAVKNDDGTVGSKVYDEEEKRTIHFPPTELIKYACQYFGSSFEGRQSATRDICGFSYKAPITINPTSGMYFFPTNSPNDKYCSWFSHSHIKKIKQAKRQQSKVYFKNGQSVVIDASVGSMKNQWYRTAQFRFVLSERLSENARYKQIHENNNFYF